MAHHMASVWIGALLVARGQWLTFKFVTEENIGWMGVRDK